MPPSGVSCRSSTDDCFDGTPASNGTATSRRHRTVRPSVRRTASAFGADGAAGHLTGANRRPRRSFGRIACADACPAIAAAASEHAWASVTVSRETKDGRANNDADRRPSQAGAMDGRDSGGIASFPAPFIPLRRSSTAAGQAGRQAEEGGQAGGLAAGPRTAFEAGEWTRSQTPVNVSAELSRCWLRL